MIEQEYFSSIPFKVAGRLLVYDYLESYIKHDVNRVTLVWLFIAYHVQRYEWAIYTGKSAALTGRTLNLEINDKWILASRYLLKHLACLVSSIQDRIDPI